MSFSFFKTTGRQSLEHSSSAVGWVLKVRGQSLPLFIKELASLFPKENILELDGSSIAPDILEYLKQFPVLDWQERTEYSIFRRPWKKTERIPAAFRIPLEPEIMRRLAQFYENHAQPEVLDHLYVLDTSGKELYLDGFGLCGGSGKAYVSNKVPESTLKEFCEKTRCSYRPITPSSQMKEAG